MPFWRESTEDKQRREEEAATRKALEQGYITPNARRRLEESRKRQGFFTSDLTSNEHLLTREAGYEPIGLVMGTSFYKLSFWGYFNGYYTTSGELAVLSQAQLAARTLAVSRLQQEAALLGANGVIGVQLKIRNHDASMIEFTAIGTAIRIPGRAPDPKPFTSDLSGQEFWQLHQAGYYPRGLVFGVCSYYVHTSWNTRGLTRGGLFGIGSGQNQEITQYTQAFQIARHLAMSRLTADTQTHQAEGSVGTHIDMGIEDIEYEINETTYHDLLIHFMAVGTAIVDDPQPVQTVRKSPLLYLNLSTGKTNEIIK